MVNSPETPTIRHGSPFNLLGDTTNSKYKDIQIVQNSCRGHNKKRRENFIQYNSDSTALAFQFLVMISEQWHWQLCWETFLHSTYTMESDRSEDHGNICNMNSAPVLQVPDTCTERMEYRNDRVASANDDVHPSTLLPELSHCNCLWKNRENDYSWESQTDGMQGERGPKSWFIDQA